MAECRPLLVLVLASACATHTTNLADSRQDASVMVAATDAAITDGGASLRLDDAGIVYCGTRPCACSDGLDNDGDGYIDGFDPECTGASDDYEDSFATGLHGEDKTAKCEDCFFDNNSGAGDDGCRRAASCGLDGTSGGGNGSCKSCAVAATCANTCGPLVPNGCDCFGCCGVWQAGAVTNILLGAAACTLANLHDVQKCKPCVPALDCANPCGTCELCPGRTVHDLPAACASTAGPGFACEGRTLCLGPADCGPLSYCQQGCCLAIGI